MTLKVKLYGDLSEKENQKSNNYGLPSTFNLEPEGIHTVLDLLKKLGIRLEEISHIFVNNNYSSPKKELIDGDRIGIFPKRMSIIFVEIKNPY